jgi:hypothetical protein
MLGPPPSRRGTPAVPLLMDKRKTRLSRDELRELVLGAGQEILQAEGIETGSDNLTFKRVFEHIERDTGIVLTNASVIRRVWENQADFQADVLASIAHDVDRPEIEDTLDVITAYLSELDLTSEELRLRAMRELCRVVGTTSSESIQFSSNWPLWISVVAMATTTSPSERRRRIRQALREGYDSITEFWERSTAVFMAHLGLRFREPWTMRQYTITTTALSEGYAMRQHIEGGLEPFQRPTGPNGELQEWTLFGAAMEALVTQCVEPDPDFEPGPVSGPVRPVAGPETGSDMTDAPTARATAGR